MVHMSVSAWSALVACVLTIAGSILLGMRASNWRIRLLSCSFGWLPLCQAVVLLDRNMSDIAAILELLASALCLTAVHLLNVENRERKSADTRLHAFETAQESQWQETVPTCVPDSFTAVGSERRREMRLPTDCAVVITVLGTDPPWTIRGTVVDLSGRGLGLKASAPIALRSAVKVEFEDLLLLAEVCRCQAVGEEFSLGLRVQECLALPAGVWRVNLDGAQSKSDLAHLHTAVSSYSDGDQQALNLEPSLSTKA